MRRVISSVIVLVLSLSLAGLARAESDEELAKKYGPKDLKPEEITKLLGTIKWETSDKPGIGDPKAVKGGRIVIGEQSAPPTLRYFGLNGNTTTTFYIHSLLCYETLVSLHPITLEYMPNLADKWFIAEDKKTFYFHMDPTAKFLNGDPVTAHDVVATWDLLTDDSIQDPFWNDALRQFERPAALTKDVVRAQAKEVAWQKFMTFGQNLFVFPHSIIGKITGKQYIEEWNNKLLPGSGPYELKESETNVKIVLKRRADWWAKDKPINKGTANFDEIEYRFVPNADLLFEKFKKGELDFYNVNISKRWVEECDFDKVKKGWVVKRKIFNQAPCSYQGLGFNIRKPPFDDVRVRQAFCHLVNRELMIEKLFYKEYDFIDTNYPGTMYQNPANPKIRYDPDKAVKLLEEAGWKQDGRNDAGYLLKDGKVFEIALLFTDKYSERWMTVLQEDLKDVGIKLNLKEVTWAEDIKQCGERNFEITSRAYGMNIFPNPEQYHSKFADRPDNNNIWGLKDPKIDELIAKEKTTFDLKERIKIVQEVDLIMNNLYLWSHGWYGPGERHIFWNRFGMPEGILPRYERNQNNILPYWWEDPEKKKILEDAIKNDKKIEPIPPVECKYWVEKYKDQK